MPVRYEVQHLMPEFLERLEKLVRAKPSIRGKVHSILRHYGEDCSRLDRSPLHNPRRKIWHTDVDREKRLIDEPLDPALPGEIAILYVDHHDAANNYGAHYRADTLGRIEAGNGRRFDVEGAGRDAVVDSAPAAAIGRDEASVAFGAYLRESQLVRIGIELPVARKVMARSIEADISDLGLSEAHHDKIQSLLLSALPAKPVAVPVPGYGAPRPLRVTSAQLPALLRLPLDRFLARMTEEQVQLATRANRHLYVVRGAAGSGKTVIGIRRIEHLLSQRDLFDERPLLFTCFNKVLRGAVEQMLLATIGGSLTKRRIEVRTIYEVITDVSRRCGLKKLGRKGKAHECEKIVAQVRAILLEAEPIARWSDVDVLNEITEIIFGRAIATLTEYLAVDRSGRGRSRALDKRGRTAIWAIYRAFRTECDKQQVSVWEHEPARLAHYLERHTPTTPTYAGIVIDEAQDLPPAAVRALVALQAGRTDDIIILGDAAQNVYRNGFRWKHFGLNVAGGQVTTIKRCFRSTRKIVEAAQSLVSSQGELMEDDLVLPEADVDADAPLVDLCLYSTADEELEQVAIAIADRITSGVPPSAIAVLIDDARYRRRLATFLTEWDCPFEELYKKNGPKSIDVFDPSVKLLTTWSAKGLEFQVLFLPRLTETAFAGDGPVGELDGGARSRRSLYTAMVRCGWELRLSATEDAQSSLLKELGPDVRRRRFSSTATT